MTEKDIILAILKSQLRIHKVRLSVLKKHLSGWALEDEQAVIDDIQLQIDELEFDI